ncbi:hypothetical protein AN958_07062 [Leucoagaricus sp. SymC.cos]|nr:hypothetical protein AN958_07062 [Leucoagaricus sp. SymC.cos]
MQARDMKSQQKRSKKIFGDGMPRLLDGPEFYTKVVEVENEHARQVAEKEKRKQAREQKASAMSQWKDENAARVKRNNDCRAAHKTAVKEWKTEARKARQENRPCRLEKPGKLVIEPPIPKPYSEETGDDADVVQDENDEQIDLDDGNGSE